MRRADLEHILRAAGAVANESDIVIVGSQAVLASAPDAPAALLVSNEADLYPLHAPEKAELIDGAIGEGSPFHDTFGYYAHGVGPETAILPVDWLSRAVRIESPAAGLVVGICPSLADLAVSKLAAGRQKDLDYVATLLGAGLVSVREAEEALARLSDPELERRVLARLHRCATLS